MNTQSAISRLQAHALVRLENARKAACWWVPYIKDADLQKMEDAHVHELAAVLKELSGVYDVVHVDKVETRQMARVFVEEIQRRLNAQVGFELP